MPPGFASVDVQTPQNKLKLMNMTMGQINKFRFN